MDIFNPKKSRIANGLEGKVILIYGGNNLGKTAQAVRFPKPFVIACEMGLNGIDNVPYEPVTSWSQFKTIIKQFTDPRQKEKARELYSTIIVDEVYASSIYAQDYVCSNYGDGALTMADGDSKHNLYQLYEKEYFRQINLLVSAGYTVVFIAHEQMNTQTGFISPKGDKRCINPIIDKCDYVVYLKSNGVDNNNNVIKSSAYLASTKEFFARARIEYTPTYLKEFTAESLTKAIQTGIDKKKELENAQIVSFSEQQALNTTEALDFDKLINEFNTFVTKVLDSESEDKKKEAISKRIQRIVESYLGPNKKVNQCSENQVEIVKLIIDDLKDEFEEFA